MIGVIADPSDHAVVREFFELFKTPWEFCRADRPYDVVLNAGDGQFEGTAKLILLYAGRRIQVDDGQQVQTGHRKHKSFGFLSYQGSQIPIYGDIVSFSRNEVEFLAIAGSHECAAYLRQHRDKVLLRIGYDIFNEVRILLTVGQPHCNAQLPALDLHIALLRDMITSCGIRLVEIPPVPDGYQFIACLTHDVDHPRIRLHKWDRTVFGFFLRATLGSLFDFVRGRISVRDLFVNWAAASKLPLVYMGVANDFWLGFDERYRELEKGHGSTFFVIPFGGRQGRTLEGLAPAHRAAGYSAQDVADTIQSLIKSGCEVGLHGIDAWIDSSKGREELDVIKRLTANADIGVRMHWLYFDQKSPQAIEAAGAAYDSTVGYNETVGYRAGTTQVYKPLETSHLLELPLHVMDTALFYLSYLGFSAQQARTVIRHMADRATDFGGVLTINWHDRSVAPERLWDESYRELINDLGCRGAWFSTAGKVISWFKMRRSAVFETETREPSMMRVNVALGQYEGLPGLRLRFHTACETDLVGPRGPADYIDVAVDESIHNVIPSKTGK
jgi:hypothetical protein